MKIFIDSREQKRINPAKEYYTKKGLDVEVSELPVGDYLFVDGENEACFEFKRVDDFIQSIHDGRVFNQTYDMAERYYNRYVLIHGTEAERNKCLAISKNYRKVTIYQYLNAISRINKNATVIECYSPYLNECFYRMLSTVTKLFDNRPLFKKFPRKNKNPALNWLIYCNYGVSIKKGQLIVNELKLKTLSDLQQLSVDDLVAINGIGRTTAERIVNGIH